MEPQVNFAVWLESAFELVQPAVMDDTMPELGRLIEADRVRGTARTSVVAMGAEGRLIVVLMPHQNPGGLRKLPAMRETASAIASKCSSPHRLPIS